MRKIFFIFAMLLMSVTSTLAEECEEVDIPFEIDANLCVDKEHFFISGELESGNGIIINDVNKISISSKNGEKITKVECWVDNGYGNQCVATAGTVDVDWDIFINDVNATSLDIYCNDKNCYFDISYIVIYYEPGNNENKKEFVMDNRVQTAFFDTSNEFEFNHVGSNISLAGNGQNFTISSTSEGVEIGKVDLTFSSNVDGATIKTGNVGDVDGSGTDWSINNVCSSSLTISTSENIENVKVYYFEVSNDAVIKKESFEVDKDTEIYKSEKIHIEGTHCNNDGLQIDNGYKVTITSTDAVISKVDLHFSYYGYNTPIKSNAGDVDGNGENWSVDNVNSSKLTITHPGDSYYNSAIIDQIIVHYKEKFDPTFTVNPVKVNGAYWTTFYSNVGNYQAPEGTQVLIAKMDGSSIVMTEIADRIVNKGQGVVLKSKNVSMEGVVMSKTNDYSSDDYSDNKLEGTSVEIQNPNYGSTYVLNWGAKGMGFYKLSSNGKIAANRAYLVYDNAGAGTAQAFFAFDSAVTGVEINKADVNENDNKVYDLQGRRVTKPANGLYIVNGKKVIMK